MSKILFVRITTIKEFALVKSDEDLDTLRDNTMPESLTDWGSVKDPDLGTWDPETEVEYAEEDSFEEDEDEE